MVGRVDTSAAQLQSDLHEAVAQTDAMRRPILTHVNADTTWLLSIPFPSHLERPRGRCRFNILVDPWLTGPQSDVASWFSTQWHVIKSSVESIAELDASLKKAEQVELEQKGAGNELQDAESFQTYVDLVVISHEFTDHCHKNTLLEVNPETPVFATTKAVELIKSWSHFKTVIDMPLFGANCNWRTTSAKPLPPWIGVSRLVTEADALYYHSAVIICIQKSQSDNAEAVIYTPHGVHAATFSTLLSASPRVDVLAFLHGLHDVSITLTKQLNLGAHNALQAQRMLQSKYWVGTHDEVKRGGGLLAPFLRRKAHTLLDALAYESKSSKTAALIKDEPLPDVSYADLGSGESLVLA